MGKRVLIENLEKKLYAELRIPDQCPHCGKIVVPNFLSCFGNASDDGYRVTITAFWSCTGCADVFATCYRPHIDNYRDDILCDWIEEVIPPIMETVSVPDEVKAVSPRFKEIFEQSVIAKQQGLTDLAGMGFRKALEVLVKDSLVFTNVKTQEQVDELNLHDAINSFKANPQLIKAALQAKFIGNDYAHYKAKYTGYDIDGLKKLIDITVHWVCMEIATQEIQSLQPA